MRKDQSTKLRRLKNAKRKRKIRKRITIVLLFICVLTTIIITSVDKKKKANPEAIAITTNSVQTMNQTQEIENNITENLTINPEQNQIETEQQENKEIESAKIKTIIDKYIDEKELNPSNFAFFYYNKVSNEYYFYNEETYFTAASTIKVPLAMLYYDKIRNGDLTLESTLQYKSEDYEAGAGLTSSTYKPGDQITISFLLEQTIVNSDNTATNILKQGLGGEKAYRILIKQYTKTDMIDEFNTENVTTAKFLYDVLERLYENQDEYPELIEYMKKSSAGGYLKRDIKEVEIAHKYGSYDGNVHDYGIVYSEEDYLIGILTKNIDDAEGLIAELSKIIYQEVI